MQKTSLTFILLTFTIQTLSFQIGAPRILQEITNCSNNCNNCSINTCVTCQNYYGLVRQQNTSIDICIRCPVNCQSCINSSCTGCQPKYGLLTQTNSKMVICVKCSANCISCLNNSCQKCQKSYGLVNQINSSISKCAKCPTNCISCANQSCTQCQMYYGLAKKDSLTNICAKCPYNCLSCSNMSCTKCINGTGLFYQNNSSKALCRECQTFCTRCFSNSSSCQVCRNSYGIEKKNNSSNNLCKKCSDFCKNCSNNSCTQCYFSYQLVLKTNSTQKICQACPLYCAICKDSMCSTCYLTYQLVRQLNSTLIYCSKCPKSCLLCKNNKCLACFTGYNLISNNSQNYCAKCPFGCTKCKNGNCISCLIGYGLFLDENSSTISCRNCLQIVDKCVTCHGNICEQCIQGFNLVILPIARCESCPFHCSQCQNHLCLKCEQGYGFSLEGNSQICNRCPPNCLACSNNATSCQECEGKYSLMLQNNQCRLCPDLQCLKCSESGVCLMCNENFSPSPLNNKCVWLNQEICILNGLNSPCQFCINYNISYSLVKNSIGKCFPCLDQYCVICEEKYPNTCLSCMAKTFWNEDFQKCQQCPKKCHICNNISSCQVCERGFGLSNGSCTLCLIHGCSECFDNIFRCAKCREGTKFSNLTNKCQLIEKNINCPPGCLFCYQNNPTKCFMCQNGYFLDRQNVVCRKCMNNCERCHSQQICLNCIAYFVLSNNTCVLCPKNCWRCSTENPSICQLCESRLFKLVDNKCIPITGEGCYSLSFENHCLLCKIGYALHPKGNCVKCISSCRYSCNPFNISQCKITKSYGDLLTQLSNFHQLQGCRSTFNDQCYIPLPGYHIELVGQKFLPRYSCLKPCSICNQIEINICYSCIDGYTLKNSTCIPNISCNPNCSVCPFQSYRDSETNNCVICKTQKCGFCPFGKCLQCSLGFYYDSNLDICKSCSRNCKICTSMQGCKACAKGYYVPYQINPNQIEICQPCHQNCLTCFRFQFICTSCRKDMKLINSRCIGEYKVAFTFKLDYNFVAFLRGTESQKLIAQISSILDIKQTQITINIIKQGSTIVEGDILTNSQQTAIATTTIMKNKKINSFLVIESNFYPTKNDIKLTEQYNIPSGLIAGIVVISVGIVGVIVGGILCYRKNRGQDGTTMSVYTKSEHNMQQVTG